jgi:ABC-type branched-subunit amino acid transport system substrate-binding protein
VHGLAAQEFANARTQHGAAIAHARVGRAPGALELDFQAVRGLAQQQGATVAQLAGPGAELVAAVDAGQRLAAGQQLVAAEGLQQRV